MASNEEDAQRGRSGGLLESRSDANPLGVAEAVNSLSVRITELGEAVGYLMEENRALQELIGRLIHFVEELGEARAKETASQAVRRDDERSRRRGSNGCHPDRRR